MNKEEEKELEELFVKYLESLQIKRNNSASSFIFGGSDGSYSDYSDYSDFN